MTRHPSKANKLRDLKTIKSSAGNITVRKCKINNAEIKIMALLQILRLKVINVNLKTRPCYQKC